MPNSSGMEIINLLSQVIGSGGGRDRARLQPNQFTAGVNPNTVSTQRFQAGNPVLTVPRGLPFFPAKTLEGRPHSDPIARDPRFILGRAGVDPRQVRQQNPFANMEDVLRRIIEAVFSQGGFF